MDPFAMDFDDKEENKEMTDDDDSRVHVPEVQIGSVSAGR